MIQDDGGHQSPYFKFKATSLPDPSSKSTCDWRTSGPDLDATSGSYFDYFLKVGEGCNFTALEMSTSQIYVVGRETSGQIAQNVLGRAPHTLRHFDAPYYRYQLLQLPASSWNNFYQLSGQDEYIPPEEVELHLRARL